MTKRAEYWIPANCTTGYYVNTDWRRYLRFANQPLAMSGNVNAVNKDKARALSTQLTSARAADSNALGIIGETNRLY